MTSKKTSTLVLSLAVLTLVLWASAGLGSDDFLQAVEPRVLAFPKDHADHPGFRAEWWYYTGNVVSAGKRPFGFQLTFFRVQLGPVGFVSGSQWRTNQLYFAHLTISDIEAGKFLVAEKTGRGAVGIGGVSFDTRASTAKTLPLEGEGQGGGEGETSPFNGPRVCVFLHGWETAIEGETHYLKAETDEFGIDLKLVSEKPPVLHGQKGLSRKGAGQGRASYYYSLTRMYTQGTLRVGGEDFEVSGSSWMDHEFSSNVLSEDQKGWDWMGLQLSDGRELMLYVLRHENGSIDPFSSGTLVQKDGTPVYLPQEAFMIQPQDYWKSPKSHARYPSAWKVEVFPYRIDLNVVPNLKDQELITEESTQVTYWEGSVGVTGSVSGQPVAGSGYVELTGYAGDFKGALLW